MAERSFTREVEDLRLGAGEVFRGEGILALTKALLQCGVGYVAGYQGSPISHLMDVLNDLRTSWPTSESTSSRAPARPRRRRRLRLR